MHRLQATAPELYHQLKALGLFSEIGVHLTLTRILSLRTAASKPVTPDQQVCDQPKVAEHFSIVQHDGLRVPASSTGSRLCRLGELLKIVEAPGKGFGVD